MNCIIPFSKDIEFDTNVSEIVSISLEHDFTANDSEILGDFTVFGEYKTHVVSINKEKFNFVLPFSVTLTNKIDKDSLEFNIEDFTYELIDNKILKVDIEYSIKALDEKDEEELFQKVENEDENIDDLIEERDNNKIPDKIENLTIAADDSKDDKLDNENEIIQNINTEDNNFVTYHIHILKENDTIETVCTKYNTSIDTLGEYNDLSNLTLGDKIIIPSIDE